MINKIKIWLKGIIEKLLSWGKESPAEEDVPVRTPPQTLLLASVTLDSNRSILFLRYKYLQASACSFFDNSSPLEGED